MDEERTRRTPVAPFTAVSTGKVTSCHTVGFGHDNHRRGVEVGEDVNFGIHGSVGTRDEQEESRAEYDQPVMQGVMYNFVKHDNSSIE